MIPRVMVVVLCFLSSCASVSTMGLARTLNQRAVQGWVGPSGGGIVALSPSPGGAAASLGYPLVEAGVRVGVTDHFELGGKLGFSGIGIEGKVAFVRTPTMDSGVNVSLNPGVTFVGGGATGFFAGTLTFHLPLLVGIDFGGHELVLGPRFIDQLFFDSSSSVGGSAINLIYAGGSVGFAVKISPSFRILPEIAIGVPIFGSVAGLGGSALGAGGLVFQAGLGFLFGTADQYEHVSVAPLTPPPLPPVAPAQPPAAPPAGL